MNPSAAQLRIDDQRLWQSLMDLAAIGATPKGGVCRIALTPEDQQGRDLVVQGTKFRFGAAKTRVGTHHAASVKPPGFGISFT